MKTRILGLPWYGWGGLLLLLLGHGAIVASAHALHHWVTPLNWWGYLFLLDALIVRRQGHSLLTRSPWEFAGICLVSIPLWLVFEGYNLLLKNWLYVGLPEQVALRSLAYGASFATILPGILETSEAVECFVFHRPIKGPPLHEPPWLKAVSVLAGTALLILPLVVHSGYLFAGVWIGFILLLEPFNDHWGMPSLLADQRLGRRTRLWSLLLAGYICGLLWEVWNYRAGGKWFYTSPWPGYQVRIFEMPVLGFLGFGPFALEEFAMYQTVKYGWLKLTRRGI